MPAWTAQKWTETYWGFDENTSTAIDLHAALIMVESALALKLSVLHSSEVIFRSPAYAELVFSGQWVASFLIFTLTG